MRTQLKQASSRGASAAARVGSVALVLPLALVGCDRNEPVPSGQTGAAVDAAAHADPGDVPVTEADVPVPASYAEAVERLVGYRDAVRQAVESGYPGKAHRPLDETNIAVERLPSIARSSGVPPRHWERIVTASEDLAEALNEIHADIDAGRKPDYAAHAEAIDDALARLKAFSENNSKLGSTD